MTHDVLSELGRHIAEQEDALFEADTPDESARRRIAQRVAGADRIRGPAIRWTAVASLAAAIVVAGAFILLRRTTADAVLSFTVGDPPRSGVLGEWVSATPTAKLPVRFSDGSGVALDANARGRVVSVSPNGADLVLESGGALIEVVPKRAADWQVHTGPFLVRVTGTRFDVEWEPEEDTFHLDLYEGKVVISGCVFGDGQPITAGNRVTASCRRGSLAVAPLGTESAPPAEAPAPAQVTLPSTAASEEAATEPVPAGKSKIATATPSPSASETSWADLARQGHYERAYELALAAGFQSECERQPAGTVLLLGDAARLTGRIDSARQAYASVRRRFPGTGEAARAAFNLGRLDVETGNHRSGILWLDTYLAEQPGGPLAAAALGRKLEAHVALGQTAAAQSVARTYLEQYSTGAHADYAQQVLGSER